MSESESQRHPTENEPTVDEFQVGDFVVFNREHPALTDGFGGKKVPAVLELINKYGEGPFRIIGIRNNDPSLIAVGHPRQILRLERIDGTPETTFNRPLSPASWHRKHSSS